MAVIRATIKSVFYLNKDTSFIVLRIHTNNGDRTALGIFPEIVDISKKNIIGEECEFRGKWIKDKKYGKEFKFESAKLLNGGTLFFFLTKVVKGIGSVLAKKLISHYGTEELLNILDNNPNKLTEFKGIKEKKLRRITTSWKKYRIIKVLSDFFAEYSVNISSNMLMRIYTHFFGGEDDYNGNFLEDLRVNPYILTRVRGIGFKTCDNIALQMGIDKNSPQRIKALIDFIMFSEASDNGHTALTVSDIIKKAKEYLEDEEGIEDKIIKVMEDNLGKNGYRALNDGVYVALDVYYTKENYIWNKVNQLLSEVDYNLVSKDIDSFILAQERKLGFLLSEEQRKAINMIASGKKISILCGYAGTGKSTVSKVVLDYYSNYIPKEQIITCAFTGMASKRIREVTGYKSSTIHSLLGFKGNGYTYNAYNLLPYKVVLVDEASMVNLEMFYRLIQALHKDTVLILVGDDAQLPPIGAGNIFNDLLHYNKIPVVKLTQIYRQSSKSVIPYFASFIRKGKMPQGYKENSYTDWHFTEQDIPNYFKLKKELPESELKKKRDELHNEMLNSITEYMKKLKQNVDTWDIQIITAMKGTSLGTRNLNKVAQQILNPKKGVKVKDCEVRIDDKVIHLKNQNMTAYKLENGKWVKKEERIYNGELGQVKNVSEEDGTIAVFYPDRQEVVEYGFEDWWILLDHAYALTIHKTQGNQFKYVIMPFVNSFYVMLNTKLIYTAITRAINTVAIVGQKYAFKRACTNIADTKRKTIIQLKISEIKRS